MGTKFNDIYLKQNENMWFGDCIVNSMFQDEIATKFKNVLDERVWK